MRLTPTSFIVLGVLDLAGAECTPYELKQVVASTIGNFWSIPHSQLYAEPERLAKAGHLRERRERGGRRRRLYAVTERGREALARWREEPPESLPELRDVALLKLFFGGDPVAIAKQQAEAYRTKLEEYRAWAALDDGGGPRGPWLALQAGIGHAEESVRYWERLSGTGRA